MKKSKEQRKKELEWKTAVRSNWGNKCAVCGKSDGKLDCHHLSYRKEVKWNPLNGVLLCVCHHKLGHLSPHKGGLEFFVWLDREHPDIIDKIYDLIDGIK